ncbi:hypothetical protein F4677DRAFT_449618 [Hypoxylon crocopeplum]|nr:hypothetical protein F4677DRAFT_449618 [Hypoxylon crocopeplum]
MCSQMDHRFFVPSEQLTGSTHTTRGDNQLNRNYRGDPSLPANRGSAVPEEKNTSLWITGLPGSTSYQILLTAIRKTGRVRSTVINGPDESHATAAASVSFFRRKDAEALYNAAEQCQFMVNDSFPKVQWNRNRVEEDTEYTYQSRVILIAGDPEIVKPGYLNWFFSTKFIFNLDCVINHGTIEGFGGPIARLEYRFGSFRSQAEFARMALSMELRGFLLAEYGEDPCAL